MNRTLLFQIPHKVGGLQNALAIFSKNGINLTRIESRPSKARIGHQSVSVLNRYLSDQSEGAHLESNRLYEFVVDVEPAVSPQKIETAIQELLSTKTCSAITQLGTEKIPWFPRKIQDLDHFANRILAAGNQLEADHPGFKDPEYRKRRTMIAKIAQEYKHGKPIPRIEYTKEEKETWKQIYQRLTKIYPEYACNQLNYVFPLLQQNCGYSEDNIPQLEDISQFLKASTGFRLRPVPGLLSSRDFLNGLAFRVFHSTQYIRHHSVPLYTPEPDVCHELLGHVPLFADHDFADFSQEIGLASLGATDEDIKKLGTLYWFTVEFGLCKQDGRPKAYGAGLLSSFGELEYSMSDKPEIRPLEPERAAVQEYPITTYQPVYFLADSFERMKEQMRNYAASLDRPFTVRYNPLTETIEVINDKSKLLSLVKSIQSKAQLLQSSLQKMNDLEGEDGLKFQSLDDLSKI